MANVLITGSSAGFGKLTVEKLLEGGHKVAASMRNVSGKNREVAETLRAKGALVLELDVTDDGTVDAAVSKAIADFNGIDILINNAGVGVLGLQEAYTIEDWQRLFAINVFGVQRVNRAVLPHMRSRGTGLIIYVSSLLGRITLPFYGPYNASKWALEALAENYRAETSAFGIDNCIVEPGGFPTSFMDALMRPSDKATQNAYGPLGAMPEQMFKGFEEALAANPKQDPQLVAEAINRLIDTVPGERPFRTVVDEMGMGEPLRAYNEQLEAILQNLYSGFQMQEMLRLKKQ
jgi:NAD(P)-dependent dehydrogenase (short-subunit alcohol dehydrogenase family)